MSQDHQGIGMTSRRTRERMVRRLVDQGIRNTAVLEVMSSTPRHIFVEEALASRAYEDTALPIGYSQTISQPYIVAKMTEALLQQGTPDTVLEVGTGCGYQTAILAQLVPKVYTVERISALQKAARKHCQSIQLRNIQYRHSDGGWGWEHYAPYLGILVTAAPLEVPQSLLEQMASGATLVIPVGGSDQQKLQKIVKTDHEYFSETIDTVKFVPLRSGCTQASI